MLAELWSRNTIVHFTQNLVTKLGTERARQQDYKFENAGAWASSQSGIFEAHTRGGITYSSVAGASKFALEGLTESLRQELRVFGINVILIKPGK